MMYQDKPQYKPDNRIIVNFAKYIVDTFNGFLLVFQSRYHQQMKRLLLTSMNWIREIIKMITMQRFQKTAVSMANVMKCILSMKTQRWVLVTLNQLKDLLYMMIQSFQSQGFSLHITMIQIVLCMVILSDDSYVYEFSNKSGMHFVDEGSLHGLMVFQLLNM